MIIDFNKLVLPTGRKVVAAYNDPNDRAEWVACKLANGNWALYNCVANAWWQNGQEFDTMEMTAGQWDSVISTHKIWETTLNKVGKVSKPCVCSISDLFNYGCPVDKTGTCRSKL